MRQVALKKCIQGRTKATKTVLSRISDEFGLKRNAQMRGGSEAASVYRRSPNRLDKGWGIRGAKPSIASDRRARVVLS